MGYVRPASATYEAIEAEVLLKVWTFCLTSGASMVGRGVRVKRAVAGERSEERAAGGCGHAKRASRPRPRSS